MGEEGGESESKAPLKRTAVESLGWITESSIMPRKHRAIEGVGPSSIFELKAQLYKPQEDSKRHPKEFIQSADTNYAQNLEVHRAKKKISVQDSFSAKNSGVDARAAKDKLELKAVNDGSASYAALERKAELYNKLVRGELSDEEDAEKYCVNFFRKGIEQNEPVMSRDQHISSQELQDKNGDDNDDSLLQQTKASGHGQTTTTVDRSEHKRFVMEVHEEASQAREKVSELKMRRQEQVAARREKLKQAYLRKQLEKLKASKAQPDSTIAFNELHAFDDRGDCSVNPTLLSLAVPLSRFLSLTSSDFVSERFWVTSPREDFGSFLSESPAQFGEEPVLER
ncbi:hypothetical protein F511_38699 [Dorcoceras hygrometricum]|uniref:Uncharacterized protein n=1 Tax=Dorcoceras hygrometricum TaxID=472368 RepID=A0A2Z7CAE5_9LAMI|nr:hypothetical protein F511_38699 [Dorcoceras hygrometricum]